MPWLVMDLNMSPASLYLKPLIQPYLRHVDMAFQKGTVGHVVGANVVV